MSGHSFTFSHALCRSPSNSIVEGLRANDHGNPDAGIFREEHEIYVAALRDAGAEVAVLDALEAYPDSVFIEDTALCLKGVAICLQQGAETRRGETKALHSVFEEKMKDILYLQSDGFVDGGDILCTDDTVMVGLSSRTTDKGASDLAPLVEQLGYKLKVFKTPQAVLHFKTASALLDNETIFSTRELSASGCFDGFNIIDVPEGEEAAANALRFNDIVFLSAGHPKSENLLDQHGYTVIPIPTTQAALVDGGLSCMSLRYSI